MRRMFLLVLFTRWAEAGPRLFQAPVISGGAKSAARTGGGGRGRVIFGKSLSCLPLSRAGSQVGVEAPFGTLRVTTVGGPRPYPVIHTEAALLAWLDERTDRRADGWAQRFSTIVNDFYDNTTIFIDF